MVGVAISGTRLLVAQRTIPIGTACAVSTGIGAVGILVCGDSALAMQMVPIGSIIAGIIGLTVA